MRPELFSLFGVPIYAYRTLLASSFVVCTLLAVRDSRRRPGGIDLSPSLGIWALLGALIGARAFYILQYESARDLWRAFLVWEGGLVFYGGLMGGVMAVAVHLRLRKTPFLNAADTCAPYLALGEAITRVGCFLNGCCWGAVCTMPWGVTFPSGSPAYAQQLTDGLIAREASRSLPLHPTQLYMTLGLTAVFFALRGAWVRRPPTGVVFFAYLLLYGLLRFFVELVRGDSARSVLGFTVSGAISAALVAIGAALCVRIVRRTRSVR